MLVIMRYIVVMFMLLVMKRCMVFVVGYMMTTLILMVILMRCMVDVIECMVTRGRRVYS